MAKQRILAVISTAMVATLMLSSNSDFVGSRNAVSQSITGRKAVLGKDSQGRYRFLVEGVVPEAPPPPKGSSRSKAMIAASSVIVLAVFVLAGNLFLKTILIK
eukprot:CAMPEP_0172726720 /NCGR_PEP_ID=MMETSP1074-20121228/91280_1 /TAXON_ID=2916 /ORGANISM="Ceratium fusus, Strain PA161109" /LENGTH=102 /DNA_ID=CAMNT_0013553809 /DNA_START=109 /DNA_END=414 /DNA_ORIENTATION=-